MMLNVKENNVETNIQDLLTPIGFFVLFYLVSKNTFSQLDYNIFYFYSFLDDLTNIITLGQLLYNYCLVDILIAGFILLVSIIGPIILTLTFNNKKATSAYRQLSRSENVIIPHYKILK